MASSGSEKVPVTTLAITRVLENPIRSEEVVEKRLKEAGFDGEDSRGNDADDLIAYVPKMQEALAAVSLSNSRGKGKTHGSVRRDDRNPNFPDATVTSKVDAVRGDVMYRLYSKVFVSSEEVWKEKVVVGGFGVAICDQRDALLFESKGLLVGRGGANPQEAAEIQTLTRGLVEASKLGIKHIAIFCDSFPIFQYVRGSWTPKQTKISMLMDDLQRIKQQFSSSQAVLVAGNQVKHAYKLARESIVSQATPQENPRQAKEYCLICFNHIDPKCMFAIGKCSHRFCFQCVKQHVEVKLLQGMIPDCPHGKCKSEMVIDACGKLLTPKFGEMWKQRIKENAIPVTDRVYCPHLRCSALMSKTKISESAKSLHSAYPASGVRICVECRGLFCVDCKVPWHGKLSCSEYKKLHPNPPADDVKLKSLANNKMWRQCGKCQHMIELTQGCIHITCRCGHEFCYNCGGGWNKKTGTCVKQCPTWDEAYIMRQDPGRAYVAPNNYFDDHDNEADEDFNLGHLYPTVRKEGKRAKTAQDSGSVEEPIIDKHLKDEMKFTGRIPSSETSFFIVREGPPCLLWDVPGKEPQGELASTNWRNNKRGGPVRNQSDHDNCWTYTSTDVYSSHRLRNNEDREFRVMSAKYLTFYVSEAERNRRQEEKGRRGKHQCHGFPVIEGLRFIKEHGVIEEDPLDEEKGYSCVKDPPSRDKPLFYFGADVEFLESDKIQDLHNMLLHQAVSANMILYQPEYDNIKTLKKVYEGPTSDESTYAGIHAVLVLAILRFKGRWVALVKLSHGTKAGASGYMYVSLSKMMINVKYSATDDTISPLKDDNNPLSDPSYLLRNFTGVNYGNSQKSVAGTSKKRGRESETRAEVKPEML